MNKFVLESEIVSIKRNDSVFTDSKYHHLLLSQQYSELHIEASLPCLAKNNTISAQEEKMIGDLPISSLSFMSKQYDLQDPINASIDDNDYHQQETQVQQQQQQQEQSSRPLSPDPTSRIDGSESDTKDLSQTRQEESETPIEATEAGSLSRTQFFSRNSAATAALRKERVLEKKSSNLSLQSMTEAGTRKSSTEGTNTKVSTALLKKRALERRYSSISSHKELSRVVRKAAAIFHTSTGAPSQQASENSHTIMLEASSALIASVLLPPLPPMEEPLSSPAITPVQKEPSIPKVQLVEDLLEEKGCLVVLCAKSPETHRNNNNNNNNNMDQYSDALLLCFDVPVYRMISMDEEVDLSQKLLGISRKSIYPQFFFERLSCEEKFDDEDRDDDNNGDDKYTYLGGFSTVKAMLLERMAYQWRSSEKRQRNSII